MRYLELTEFPLITSRLTAGVTRRFQNSYNGKAMVGENIGFRYLYTLKLLPTYSYISIVVSARIGRFSQNGSHM